MNDNEEQVSGGENAGAEQPCCDGGDCCPSGSGSGGKSWKTVIVIIMLIAAGVVIARSFTRKSNAEESEQVFAPILMDCASDTPSSPGDAVEAETEEQDIPVKGDPSLWKAELDSLASLNTAAVNADAVFILLSAGDQQDNQAITGEIDAAAQKIKSSSVRVSAFRLNEAAPDYGQLAKQFGVPCVLAMVKGGGMSAVSGEISEARLVQAFVTASRPTAGCCPPGSTTCPPQE
jgi:hypothetical protein